MKKLNEGSKYWLNLFQKMCPQSSINEWAGIDFYDIAKAAKDGDKSAREAIFWQMKNIIEATYAKNKKSVYLWSNQLGLFEKNPEGSTQVNEMALNWISTSWAVIFEGYPVSDGETVGPLIKHVQPTRGLDYLSWIYSKKILNLLYKEYYLNNSTGLSKNKGIDTISANLYADKRQDNGGNHSIKREIIDDWQSETNIPEEDLAISDALRSFRRFTRDPELNEKKHGFSPMIAFRTVIMNMAKGEDAERNVANLAVKYNVSRNTFASYANKAATTLVNKYDVSLDELQQLIKVYGSEALGRTIKEKSYRPKPLARINENYDFRLLESIFNGKVLLNESDESIYKAHVEYEKEHTANDKYIFCPIGEVGHFLEKHYDDNRVIVLDGSFTGYILTYKEVQNILNKFDIEDSEIFKYPLDAEQTRLNEFERANLEPVDKSFFKSRQSTVDTKDVELSNGMRFSEFLVNVEKGLEKLDVLGPDVEIPLDDSHLGITLRRIKSKIKLYVVSLNELRLTFEGLKKAQDLNHLRMFWEDTQKSMSPVKESKERKYWNNFFDKLIESRGTYTGNIAECPCCGHTIRQDQFEDYTCKECGEFWDDDDLDWHPDGDEYEDGYDNRIIIDPLEQMSESTNLKEHKNPYASRAAEICKSLTKDIDFDNDDNAMKEAADRLVEFIDSMIEQSMDYFPVDDYEPDLYKIWEEHEKRHK